MNKKFLYPFLLLVLFLATTLVFSGCSLLKGSKNDENNNKTKTIEKVDMSTAEIDIVDMEYTGEEITLFEGKLSIRANDRWLNLSDFDLSYSNNINVGKASVTFTAKDTCIWAKGSTTRNFNIVPPSFYTEVETVEEVQQLLASPNYIKVCFFPKTDANISANTEIVVPEGKSLTIKANVHNIHNYGTIISYGDLSFGASNMFPIFYNVGTIEAHGNVAIVYARIFNSGIFSSDKTISNNSQVYSDTELNIETHKQDAWSSAEYKTRTQISADKIQLYSGNTALENNKLEYNESSNTPTAKFDGLTLDFRYEYSQNDRVSAENYKAKVIISVAEYDQRYGGSVEIEFDIVKGKTTFSILSELIEKQQTGNYNQFTCSLSYFTFDSNFTIAEDETLLMKFTTIAEGTTLTNNGNLSLRNKLTIDGSLLSNGTISSSSTFVGAGAISLGANAQTTFDTIQNEYVGTLTNNGELVFSASNNKINCSLTNNGSIDFKYGTDMNNDASITNNQNATIVFGSISSAIKRDFGTAQLVNNGTITNNTTIAWANTAQSISNHENGIVNNGKIYCNVPIQNLTTNVVVRKNLQEATCTLDEDNFEYDRTAKEIVFRVDGEVLPTSKTTLQFLYPGESVAQDMAIRAGTNIQAILRVNSTEKYCEYYGQAQIAFTINKVAKEIANISDFTTYVGNENYSSFTLTNSINLSFYSGYSATQKTFTIYEDQTLSTNGHQLFLMTGTKIDNFGTIVVDEMAGANPSAPTLETCGIVVSENAWIALESSATLTNNGTIVVRYTKNYHNCRLTAETGAQILGSGTIFTNKNTGALVSATNTIYTREVLNTFGNVSLDNDILTFNGQIQVPQVLATIASTNFDTAYFDVVYNNGNDTKRRGTYPVDITTKTEFDQNFVGERTLEFTIQSNIKEISSAADWRNAYFDAEHDQYDIVASFTVTNGLNIRDDIILNFGSYRLTNLKNYTITTGPNTEVWMDIANITDYNNYCYFATKITITADIAGVLRHDPSTSNLNSYNGPRLTRTAQADFTAPAHFEIDLNGHTIESGANIANNSNSPLQVFITNSSDNVATLAASTATYALYQNYSSNDLSLTISPKIAISGIILCGCGDKKLTFRATNVTCVQTNRTNESSTDTALSISSNAKNCDILFTNCSFTGRNAAIIRGANQVFDNCTFRSTGNNDGCGVLIHQNKEANGPYVNVTFLGGAIYSSHSYGIFVHGRDLAANDSPRCSVTISKTNISAGSGKSKTAAYRTRDQYVFTTP